MVAPTIAGRVDYDLDEATYRARPRLSYSGAKVLLDCPARYHYETVHGRPDKRAYDFGHVVHLFVLGEGAQVEVIDAPDWRTKAAQQARDEARAAGRVPLLAHEAQAAHDAASEVLRSPYGALFTGGRPEVSLLWNDEPTGVPCKARADYLRPDAFVDLKTCESAHPAAIAKAMASYDYPIQQAAYVEGGAACGLGLLPFVFVFVEKTPPYLVHGVQIDPDDQPKGARRWREAVDLYDACLRAGRWPSYANDITTIRLPAYYR